MFGEECERVEETETDKGCWTVWVCSAVWFDEVWLLMVIVWLPCGMREMAWYEQLGMSHCPERMYREHNQVVQIRTMALNQIAPNRQLPLLQLRVRYPDPQTHLSNNNPKGLLPHLSHSDSPGTRPPSSSTSSKPNTSPTFPLSQSPRKRPRKPSTPRGPSSSAQ